jgi:hypothetical protein
MYCGYDAIMRAKITIDETLYNEVKDLAAQDQRTVDSVVEDALRLFLRGHESHMSGEFVPLPTFPGKLNIPIGIDPNSTSEILNLLDELDRV